MSAQGCQDYWRVSEVGLEFFLSTSLVREWLTCASLPYAHNSVFGSMPRANLDEYLRWSLHQLPNYTKTPNVADLALQCVQCVLRVNGRVEAGGDHYRNVVYKWPGAIVAYSSEGPVFCVSGTVTDALTLMIPPRSTASWTFSRIIRRRRKCSTMSSHVCGCFRLCQRPRPICSGISSS